jgi:hypothetical protein
MESDSYSYICFAETPSQAAAANACGYPVTIVAIHPVVDYWAEKSSVAVRSIEDLFDERSHRHLGAEVIDRVESFVAAIDALLEVTVPQWGFSGAVSFAAFFHYANGTFDALVLRLEQILSVCDVLTDQNLLAFRPRNYEFSGITAYDHAPWGLTTNLVPLVATVRGIDVHWIDALGDDPSDYNPLRDVYPRTVAPPTFCGSHSPTLINRVLGKLRRVAKRLHSSIPLANESVQQARPCGPLLITSLSSDIGDSVSASWIARGGRVMSMNQAFPLNEANDTGRQASAACEVLWEKLGRDPEIRALLVWKGVDLWPLFSPWLKRVILGALPPLYQRAEAVWARLKDEGGYRDAAFLAGGWVTDHYVVARIANDLGLPTASCHYGGFLGFSLLPQSERYDFAECDYFLCGGVGAERTFRQPAPQTRWNPKVKRAVPVGTGMPWLSSKPAMHSNIADGPRRIMLILNALVGDCRNLGYTSQPEIGYWRFTRAVIKKLQEKHAIEIIIKPPMRTRYPQMPNPVIEWVRECDFNEIMVVEDMPLSDCLGLADAYIVESPSTPLLQALETGSPVLVYINRSDYLLQPDAANALRDCAAVFAESEADFLDGLESFLSQPEWVVKDANNRFRREYMVGESRNPANRIADFLRTVIPQGAGGHSQETSLESTTHLPVDLASQ